MRYTNLCFIIIIIITTESAIHVHGHYHATSTVTLPCCNVSRMKLKPLVKRGTCVCNQHQCATSHPQPHACEFDTITNLPLLKNIIRDTTKGTAMRTGRNEPQRSVLIPGLLIIYLSGKLAINQTLLSTRPVAALQTSRHHCSWQFQFLLLQEQSHIHPNSTPEGAVWQQNGQDQTSTCRLILAILLSHSTFRRAVQMNVTLFVKQ